VANGSGARDEDWWRPENLLRAEREARSNRSIDTGSDFGSYGMLARGDDLTLANIAIHNDVRPLPKVRSIARMIGHSDPRSILDAGCGAGFTTAALSTVYPLADVLGVDLAVDAIAYAEKTHEQARFIAAPITPDSAPLGAFDLIFCFEFYPFTRNVDAPAQAEFVRYFVDQLRPGGALVIYQTWKNPNSLAACFDEVRALTPGLRYIRKPTPHARLAERLPHSVALALSWAATTFAGRDWQKPIVVVTRESEGS
jgi:SAM-dependent methyltransferase